MKLMMLGISGGILSVATPAASQATPSNAHAFIKAVLDRGTNVDGRRGKIHSPSSAECKTEFRATGDVWYDVWTIDWSKVSKISVSGSEVTVQGAIHDDHRHQYGSNEYGTKSQASILVESDELAQRLVKAMEVIRVKCDALNHLGF